MKELKIKLGKKQKVLFAAMEKRIQMADERLFDMLLADDGQAYKEAYRYMEKFNPAMIERLNQADQPQKVSLEQSLVNLTNWMNHPDRQNTDKGEPENPDIDCGYAANHQGPTCAADYVAPDWFDGDMQKISELYLSGDTFKIGIVKESNPSDDSVWIKTDEMIEATHLSKLDVTLLIAALQHSIGELPSA